MINECVLSFVIGLVQSTQFCVNDSREISKENLECLYAIGSIALKRVLRVGVSVVLKVKGRMMPRA